MASKRSAITLFLVRHLVYENGVKIETEMLFIYQKTPCDFEFSKTVIEELLKPRRLSDIGGSTSQRLKLVGRKSLAKSIRYTLSK